LSGKIEAVDSGQGFRDNYVHQLAVILDILSIWPSVKAYSCMNIWVINIEENINEIQS
jgi:hypothetical protein